jgi:homoserine dehydrogenase
MREKSIRIGLLGFGTVGQGLVQGALLHSDKIVRNLGTDIQIRKALVRDLNKERGLEGIILTKNPSEIINDPEIDVIVEVMGNEHPTYSYVKQALLNGKHVVTANKLLLAIHGLELQALATRKGVQLLYEGSVLGGIPILRTIQHGLSGDRVEEVSGILNGTTNFILTQMTESGKEYDEALNQAQQAGYAESDPTMDVSGLDAACKLVILCRECFDMNIRIEEVVISGIQDVSAEEIGKQKELGRVPKLVARASVVIPEELDERPSQEKIQAKVGVEWLSVSDVLSQVSGVDNGLSLKTQLVGELFWRGPGAGGLATGGAVLSDVLEVAQRVVQERREGFAVQ